MFPNATVTLQHFRHRLTLGISTSDSCFLFDFGATMILAGDVGGTKCSLGLFVEEGAFLRPVFQRRLATRNYGGFEQLIADFLNLAAGASETKRQPRIEAAGFGLAGVVVDGSLHAGNLPWVLDAAALTRKLNLKYRSTRRPGRDCFQSGPTPSQRPRGLESRHQAAGDASRNSCWDGLVKPFFSGMASATWRAVEGGQAVSRSRLGVVART